MHQESQTGGEDAPQPAGFDFGMATSPPEAGHIKRVFKIRHSGHLGEKTVIQLQCISWPDFDVPETPEVLLSLIREVDTAMEEVHGDDERGQLPPVLVHCELYPPGLS